MRGENCRYEHQADAEGKPSPVGQEFLQRYDRAVKPKAQHRDMCGEIAECKVPSLTVYGQIVQILRSTMILISQEWLTTIATWKIVAESEATASRIVVYRRRSPTTPSSQSEESFAVLLKELFCEAMEDIHIMATLQSRYSLFQLKKLLQEQRRVEDLQVHAVTDVQPTEAPAIQITRPTKSDGFQALKGVTEIAGEFTKVQSPVNHNRARLTAKPSLSHSVLKP